MESLHATEQGERLQVIQVVAFEAHPGQPGPGVPDPPSLPVVIESVSQCCLSSDADSPESCQSLYRYVFL